MALVRPLFTHYASNCIRTMYHVRSEGDTLRYLQGAPAGCVAMLRASLKRGTYGGKGRAPASVCVPFLVSHESWSVRGAAKQRYVPLGNKFNNGAGGARSCDQAACATRGSLERSQPDLTGSPRPLSCGVRQGTMIAEICWHGSGALLISQLLNGMGRFRITLDSE